MLGALTVLPLRLDRLKSRRTDGRACVRRVVFPEEVKKYEEELEWHRRNVLPKQVIIHMNAIVSESETAQFTGGSTFARSGSKCVRSRPDQGRQPQKTPRLGEGVYLRQVTLPQNSRQTNGVRGKSTAEQKFPHDHSKRTIQKKK